MLQTAVKVDEKNGVICLVSMFPSCVMVLKLSKKMYFFFLRLCTNLSKKSKFIKTIYMYTSYGIVYCAMTYCFGDIRVWIRRTLLNFCWASQHLFWYFNCYYHERWLRPLKLYHFLKEWNENFQMHKML